MPLSTVCPAPKALTLDLDDTLWPVRPTLVRAEQVLNAWLRVHAPATAEAFDAPAMLRLRVEIGRRHPELVHDLTELRLITLREALQRSGDDPALAPFLGFLARDIAENPGQLRAVDAGLAQRIKTLVGIADVDLDTPLSADDE